MKLRFVCLTFWVASAFAQVVARQGIPESEKAINFKSPMILEMPVPELPKLASLKESGKMILPSVERYVCDSHVTILNLLITHEPGGWMEGQPTDLVVEGSANVLPSYDRFVDFVVRILKDGTAIAQASLYGMKASEKKLTPFRIPFPVSKEMLSRISSPGSKISVELTVTVRDNS